ncbi:MAG: DUF1206 domain-containing protein [Planctomycetaceae bacterium]
MSVSSSQSHPHQTTWRGFTTAELPEVPHWIEVAGRAGHVIKGVVYMIVGFVAFKLAIGAGGQISGARGAIREIGNQPFGQTLLAVTAICLFGYTAWRWVQALRDTEGVGDDLQGIIKRLGYAMSGAAYAFLGVYAATRAIGTDFNFIGGGDTTKSYLSTLPGQIVLAIAGAIVIGTGFFFIYKGFVAKFMRTYNLAAMSDTVRKIALYAGRMGLMTRGVAFIIIGGFLISSVVQGINDGEISGLSDALAAIAAQTYGKVLLAITGFGLMCYAIHCLLKGWFRRFNVTG